MIHKIGRTPVMVFAATVAGVLRLRRGFLDLFTKTHADKYQR